MEAKIWSFQPKFGYFWPFWTNINNLNSICLFKQNDVVSEQYFLYGKTDDILFQMPVNFQEVIGIFGEDITV